VNLCLLLDFHSKQQIVIVRPQTVSKCTCDVAGWSAASSFCSRWGSLSEDSGDEQWLDEML